SPPPGQSEPEANPDRGSWPEPNTGAPNRVGTHSDRNTLKCNDSPAGPTPPKARHQPDRAWLPGPRGLPWHPTPCEEHRFSLKPHARAAAVPPLRDERGDHLQPLDSPERRLAHCRVLDDCRATKAAWRSPRRTSAQATTSGGAPSSL